MLTAQASVAPRRIIIICNFLAWPNFCELIWFVTKVSETFY